MEYSERTDKDRLQFVLQCLGETIVELGKMEEDVDGEATSAMISRIKALKDNTIRLSLVKIFKRLSRERERDYRGHDYRIVHYLRLLNDHVTADIVERRLLLRMLGDFMNGTIPSGNDEEDIQETAQELIDKELFTSEEMNERMTRFKELLREQSS